MPNNANEDLPPAGEAAPASVSIAADSVSEVNDQLESVNLSDQDEARPPAATPGDTNPKEVPDLWKPPPPTEECPVCLVPLPLENPLHIYWTCCGKLLCKACCEEHDRALRVTNRKREKKKQPPLEKNCAFCRSPVHENDAELIGLYEKRIEKGDTHAMVQLAYRYRDGDNGLRKDEAKAFELLQMAVGQGCAEAIAELGRWAADERFASTLNRRKAKEYFENAAMKGDVPSRFNLALELAGENKYDLAIKHWNLAAAAGHDRSMKCLWDCFYMGKLSRPDLEKALRAHKAASDEMNSEERERWDAWKKAKAGNDELLRLIYASYYLGHINAKDVKAALKLHRAGDWRALTTLLASKDSELFYRYE